MTNPNEQIEDAEPVHIVSVYDNRSNHEALYLAGELYDSCYTIYACDIARAADGKAAYISWVAVTLPDNKGWPKQFEMLMPYVDKDEEVSATLSESKGEQA